MAGSGLTFIESGGLVCMEAENATRIVDGTTVNVSTVSDASAVGGEYVVGSSSAAYSTWLDSNAPYVEWDVQFGTSGTYYFWTRSARDGSNDTMLFGLDGVLFYNARTFGYLGDNLTLGWSDNNFGGSNTVSIPSAGTYTIRFQLRETLAWLDRVLMTTNASYDPSTVNGGDGPAESSTTGGGGGTTITPGSLSLLGVGI